MLEAFGRLDDDDSDGQKSGGIQAFGGKVRSFNLIYIRACTSTYTCIYMQATRIYIHA